MKNWIIIIAFSVCAFAIYKISFTIHVMDKLGLHRADLGQDFIPVPSELKFSPPGDIASIFTTNDFSVALVQKLTSSKTIGANFLCEMEDTKLKFMILVRRRDLIETLPGLEHLSTDQILDRIYNSRSSDIYLSITPGQIIQSVSRYKLKTILTTTLCEQEWHTVLYAGRKAFVAVSPKALSIDVPSTDGTSYVHLFLRKPNATFEDASILNKVLVTKGTE